MSHKSNVKKAHRGGLSHHQMKRGLNNWGKGTPSIAQTPEATPEEILIKESAAETLQTVASEIGLHGPNVHKDTLSGDNIGRRNVGRVM